MPHTHSPRQLVTAAAQRHRVTLDDNTTATLIAIPNRRSAKRARIQLDTTGHRRTIPTARITRIHPPA